MLYALYTVLTYCNNKHNNDIINTDGNDDGNNKLYTTCYNTLCYIMVGHICHAITYTTI